MKKIIIIAAAVTCLVSCAMPCPTPEAPKAPKPEPIARLISTGKNVKVIVHDQITTAPLIADLKVSENKINYVYIPSKAAVAEGEENCVKCAIREALSFNGNADVIVGMETQIKFDGTFYNGKPVIESIIVTGYPARYTNFRHPDFDYFKNGEYLLPAELRPQPQAEPAPAPAPAPGYTVMISNDGAGMAEVQIPVSFKLEKDKPAPAKPAK